MQVLLKLIPHKRLEWLSGFVLASIASLVSPAWPLLNTVMKPMMEIIFSANNVLSGYIHLVRVLSKMDTQVLITHFQLPILIVFGLHLLFLGWAFKMGVRLAQRYLTHADEKTEATVTA